MADGEFEEFVQRIPGREELRVVALMDKQAV
jgi:hypothetical protein